MKNSFYIKETHSTNDLLYQMARQYELPEGFVLYTDFQTSGKGQQGNSWESQPRKNLLFSLVLYPKHIATHEQFIISQTVSIGIKKTLDKYTGDISIKWPNDIYWKDKKIVGILIENSLSGANIRSTVIGIGMNINQDKFSHCINPVSLKQITGKTFARKPILKEIRESILNIYYHWDSKKIRSEYMKMLYRKSGFHTYKANEVIFEAGIQCIQPDGRLDLETTDKEIRSFYFKEVEFL